jgi:predicted transposase YdaD
MSDEPKPASRRSVAILRELTPEEQKCYGAELREKIRRDKVAREEFVAEEAAREAVLQKNLSLIEEMLADELPIETIAKYLKLSVDEVKQIQQGNFNDDRPWYEKM